MRQFARSLAHCFPALGRAVALALVMPFVLLSLMAQGTMVAQGAAPESFMVVLCADHLPVEMVLDETGNVVPDDEYRTRQGEPVSQTPKPPCDWSFHAQPVLEGLPMLPLVTASPAGSSALAPRLDLRMLRAEVLAPAARGPPVG
ncbi:hypothetical protein [Paracoccus ravus]|uniref:hypothetical protein n=1 Tax=Paracoccus ravus TaxID=2447760 RepID=UPI00106EC2C1|nr:hypothetical protein [Paracoccus ravus]